MDRQFNFIRVNEAYARADNKKIEDFPGRNHFDLYPSAARDIFERVVRTGQAYHVEAAPFVYARNPDRGTSYWDWTLAPLRDADGQVQYLVLSLRDVTDAKRVESALRAERGKIPHAGRGHRRRDLPAGRGRHDRLRLPADGPLRLSAGPGGRAGPARAGLPGGSRSPPDGPAATADCAGRAAAGIPPAGLRRAGGLVEDRSRAILNDHDQLIGVTGILRNISHRKAAEETLARREAILEAVQFAAARFLGGPWQNSIHLVLEPAGRGRQRLPAISAPEPSRRRRPPAGQPALRMVLSPRHPPPERPRPPGHALGPAPEPMGDPAQPRADRPGTRAGHARLRTALPETAAGSSRCWWRRSS